MPAALSPTADSPGYVLESDPEEDPEEDDDEDPEEDPADYPANGGDDGDESFDDDEDDDAPSAEETEPFEINESTATPPPHPIYRTPCYTYSTTITASPWSSPLPQIPSPPLPPILSPLPVSPPLLVSYPPPASPICPLGYRAAMIWLRVEAPSTSHSLPLPPPIILSHTRSDAPSSGTPPLLPIPAPTSSPPFLQPSTNRREDRPEVTLPPRKRLGIALGPRYEVERARLLLSLDRLEDEMLEDMPAAPATDDTELGRRMTEFATRVRQDTDEIYTRSTDDMLYKDRRTHARTGLLMEREARMSREAWGQSMDASDLAHSEVMSLRTTVLGQQAVITELQAADRRRQAAITELLAMDRRRQAKFIEALKLLKRLQTQMTEFEMQQGPAKGPLQPDAPEEASSNS
ncbi:hypothetical protein Tco_1433468 [Tanacetum coccineum]